MEIYPFRLKKKRYEEASKEKDYHYEWLLYRELEKIIESCDEKIQKSAKRLKASEEFNEPQSSLDQEIESLAQRACTLGEEGKLEESQDVFSQIEELKKQRHKELTEVATGGNSQKLQVCEVCSLKLSSKDSNKRLADHFGGKLHMGFRICRDRLDLLREKYKNGPPPNSRELIELERVSSQSGQREPDRSFDHDRDFRGDRDRDRGRDNRRDRDRDYRRDYDRDRHRDRERLRHDRDRDQADRDTLRSRHRHSRSDRNGSSSPRRSSSGDRGDRHRKRDRGSRSPSPSREKSRSRERK